MEEYLEVIQDGEIEDVRALGESVVEITSSILQNSESDETAGFCFTFDFP